MNSITHSRKTYLPLFFLGIFLSACSQSSIDTKKINSIAEEKCKVYRAVLDGLAQIEASKYPDSEPANYYISGTLNKNRDYIGMEEWPIHLLKRNPEVSKAEYRKWKSDWISRIREIANTNAIIEPNALRYAQVKTRNEAWNSTARNWLSDEEIVLLLKENSNSQNTSEEVNAESIMSFRLRDILRQRAKVMENYKENPDFSEIGIKLKEERFRSLVKFYAVRYMTMSKMGAESFATVTEVDDVAWKQWMKLQFNQSAVNVMNCSVSSLGESLGGIYDGRINTLSYADGTKEIIDRSSNSWPENIQEEIYQFYDFTAIGFDDNRTKAFLMGGTIPTRHTGRGGSSSIYYVQKINGQWVMTNNELLWVG